MATASKKTATRSKAGRSKKQAATKAAPGTEVPVRETAGTETAKAPGLVPWPDVERLFEDFMQRRWLHPRRWEWPRLEGVPGLPDLPSLLEQRAPSVDVVDRDNEIVVRAEVPGVEKKDLDVSITNRTLTIKGSTRTEQKQEKGDYFRQEIRTGSMSRTVTLPADVDASKAKAELKDGVVELTLPKKPSAKRQKIELG